MAARGNTKTITVSFPVELAKQAEHLAKTESRTMRELFREVFRTYRIGQYVNAWRPATPTPQAAPLTSIQRPMSNGWSMRLAPNSERGVANGGDRRLR